MVGRAMWKSEALRVVPWLRPCTSRKPWSATKAQPWVPLISLHENMLWTPWLIINFFPDVQCFHKYPLFEENGTDDEGCNHQKSWHGNAFRIACANGRVAGDGRLYDAQVTLLWWKLVETQRTLGEKNPRCFGDAIKHEATHTIWTHFESNVVGKNTWVFTWNYSSKCFKRELCGFPIALYCIQLLTESFPNGRYTGCLWWEAVESWFDVVTQIWMHPSRKAFICSE